MNESLDSDYSERVHHANSNQHKSIIVSNNPGKQVSHVNDVISEHQWTK